ncbi:hypothetical protein SLEP1_g10500 [Rubroshorea leprosula]|uniref:alpha-amylase n=1 Tax=Rubroshorea leprosula TaxID=152421 RepID=A0AAV5I899_9ROSI|nr:hypothetical protein SLEP1_g10500 [Rubroshorea leprosula]
MGFVLSSAGAFQILPQCAVVSSGTSHGCISNLCIRPHHLNFRSPPIRHLHNGNWRCKQRIIVVSSKGDEGDGDSSRNEVLEEDELVAARKALSETRARQEALEKEKDQLLEELARSETKHQEYMATILHDKDVAISELESVKLLFHQKLQESKQDLVELAVQVEKLAENTFQQVTSYILEDAQLRVSAAETSAAEMAYQIEEKIRNASEGVILSVIEQSKDAIAKALDMAEKAGEHATKAVAASTNDINSVDMIASVQSENMKLKSAVSDLESQLLLSKSKFDRLKLELQQAHSQVNSAELQANDADKALLEFQEASRKNSLEQGEETSPFLEKMNKDAAEREKAVSEAFKAELESIKAAIEAAKETTCSKDNAYMRTFQALQRSLRASESALKIWRQRAEMAESLLLNDGPQSEEDEDVIYAVNGGRLGLLADDDSQKWKLLSDGPRREVPQWMARRIWAIRPNFPPRAADITDALKSKFRSLELPKLDEVWSIAQQKPKEGDVLIGHVIEKETIEKKRKALERALQRKTTKWERTLEQTKSEPGTGTGREIVFQGFNWESWRRQWYLELAPKSADLSQSGITAVWLPPPTESVAPQGYMPSDLYNLNSAYGSNEELKHCIEELHAHDLLALGDVVLNHRCAQKQSPDGVWNIFGGKLAWGPEAIVCDDPNFQGQGNPSSGDIFHAAPNIDHSQDFVRRDIKEWLNWLRTDICFDGWRLDFVRGFSGSYVKEYIESSNPAFSIGEYWDSLAYENGNLCYNQDAHRQRIINWINATDGTSSAFDVTTKGILHSALHNEYWRLIDPQGKPPGVMGWWPSRAVTFLENHDTGSTQGHWPFPREKLAQGYAYILTHPGTPVIFYDHFYDFGLHDIITELIETRRRGGVHCRSSVTIYHANNEGYVAQIGDTLVIKLGQFDWNPSKENQMEGSWHKFVDKGLDYQVWIRQ